MKENREKIKRWGWVLKKKKGRGLKHQKRSSLLLLSLLLDGLLGLLLDLLLNGLLLGDLLLNRLLLGDLLLSGLLSSRLIRNNGLLGSSLGLVGDHLVDGLHEHTLATVHVTLGLLVKSTVLVTVDLARSAVATKETTKNADTADPEKLRGHTCLTSTLPGTKAIVTTLLLCLVHLAHACTGVHLDGTTDDETVLHQLADVSTAVGKRDLGDLSGIHPDTLPAAAKNGGRQTLLKLQRNHFSEDLTKKKVN